MSLTALEGQRTRQMPGYYHGQVKAAQDLGAPGISGQTNWERQSPETGL